MTFRYSLASSSELHGRWHSNDVSAMQGLSDWLWPELPRTGDSWYNKCPVYRLIQDDRLPSCELVAVGPRSFGMIVLRLLSASSNQKEDCRTPYVCGHACERCRHHARERRRPYS